MNKYVFIDYLNVYRIELIDDMACMEAAYYDPETVLLVPECFDLSFALLYDILSKYDWIINGDTAMDDMAKALVKQGNGARIQWDADDAPLFHGLLWRLEKAYTHDKNGIPEEVGYCVVDVIPMEECNVNCQQFMHAPAHMSKKNKQKVGAAFRALSAHLGALALRYEYYRLSVAEERLTKKVAREYTNMEDEEYFEVAKSAYELMVLKGGLGNNVMCRCKGEICRCEDPESSGQVEDVRIR